MDYDYIYDKDDEDNVFRLFGAQIQNYLNIYGTTPAGSVALETNMLTDLF